MGTTGQGGGVLAVDCAARTEKVDFHQLGLVGRGWGEFPPLLLMIYAWLTAKKTYCDFPNLTDCMLPRITVSLPLKSILYKGIPLLVLWTSF